MTQCPEFTKVHGSISAPSGESRGHGSDMVSAEVKKDGEFVLQGPHGIIHVIMGSYML